MPTVNTKLSRWKQSVQKYLFAAPAIGKAEKAELTLEEFRREAQTCIDAPFGEVDARNRAARLGAAYAAFDEETRAEVLLMLLREFGPDRSEIDRCIERYQQCRDDDCEGAALALSRALQPRRMALLTRFTSLPDGVKFLVDMRSEILALTRRHRELKTLDADFANLFKLWFDPGFLDIERVTWMSPGSVLEKLTEYEANHSIVSWKDLKNRLDGDRRCYTLFHPRMPQEPLTILHVALNRGIAANVQQLLDVETPITDPEEADTAVFYSITSPQKGLRGISFGEYLIKQAVKELRSELPDLHTFVTLSPVPGFRSWLDSHVVEADFDNLPFSPVTLDSALDSLVSTPEPPWRPELEKLLSRKCLEYLTTMEGGRPLNSVARFHLRNGAYIHRVNLFGDMSKNGLRNAAGMMVNYGYNLRQMESNLTLLQGGKLPVAGAVLKQAKAAGLNTEHLEGV